MVKNMQARKRVPAVMPGRARTGQKRPGTGSGQQGGLQCWGRQAGGNDVVLQAAEAGWLGR